MLPVSFENEGWQASCRPHLVISADSMTRKRHENAMNIVMKGEVSPHDLAFQSKCGYDGLPCPLLVAFEYERKEARCRGRTDLPPRTQPIDPVNPLAHVHSGNRAQV